MLPQIMGQDLSVSICDTKGLSDKHLHFVKAFSSKIEYINDLEVFDEAKEDADQEIQRLR